MKVQTLDYLITFSCLRNLFKQFIIESNVICVNKYKHAAMRFDQLLFGMYNAFDEEAEFLFAYGENESTYISKIANGKQNVGPDLQYMILHGIYREEPKQRITPEGIKYICDRYMVPEKVGQLVTVIKEMIRKDPLVYEQPYIELLNEKKTSEFIYKVLTEIAIHSYVKPQRIVHSARGSAKKMSKKYKEAVDFEISVSEKENEK